MPHTLQSAVPLSKSYLLVKIQLCWDADEILRKLNLVVHLARLHFLVPGFMLYVAGCLLAILNGASWNISKFLFGYAIFGCAHISVSFSNDYFDRESDKNSVRTMFSGGSKILVENPQLKNLALRLAMFFLVASAISATLFTLVFDYSYWFLAFAILGGLLGWFYTAPPLKLAYRNLGEISTMLAVGLVMPGMGYFVAHGSIDLPFAFFAVPLSCYGLLFILTVEIPDVQSDRAAKKTSVIVRFGVRTGILMSLLSALGGTLALLVIHLSGITMGKVDLGLAVVFSIIPIAGVTSTLLTNLRQPYRAYQVTINMISMILFLFLFNLNLLQQIISKFAFC